MYLRFFIIIIKAVLLKNKNIENIVLCKYDSNIRFKCSFFYFVNIIKSHYV